MSNSLERLTETLRFATRIFFTFVFINLLACQENWISASIVASYFAALGHFVSLSIYSFNKNKWHNLFIHIVIIIFILFIVLSIWKTGAIEYETFYKILVYLVEPFGLTFFLQLFTYNK